MHKSERYVRHFNRLNGKPITKKKLKQFHSELKKELDSKRIDVHCPYGIECIQIEKRLSKAIKKMNGYYEEVGKVKINQIPIKRNLIITPTTQGKEIVKGKKVLHYHHEDLTVLNGLENIQNDMDICEGSLDGPNETTYKVITDRILDLMASGELIWRRAWNEKVNGPTELAHNYVTKNLYRGGNYYLNYLRFGIDLKVDGKKKRVKYDSPFYFTFKQIKDLKGTVKPGEKAWPVVYFKWLYKDIKKNKLVDRSQAIENGELKEGFERFPGLFYYNVFNYEQTSGITVKQPNVKPKTEEEKIESAELIVEQMPVKPEIKIVLQDRAFYSWSKDSIQIPPISQFKIEQRYYSVLFHEMIHSTGHEKRIGRDLTGDRRSKGYAFEELIAELGASYLCGHSGILYHTMKDSAAYIQSWSGRLKEELREDPKFFLKASGQAQKAADFILNITDEKEGGLTVQEEKKIEKKSKSREPVKRTEIKKDPVKNLSGFTTADQAPEVPENMIKLPGTIGNLLGEMQGYKLEIVIAGETHSSKSELGKQIADAFASAGFEVALIDWEQGGLASRDTMESIKRNIKPENLKKIHVSSEVPRDLESIKALAKQFKVILLDSGTKLNQVTNEWIDELRNEYPDTIWIILMQQNTKGGTRGGSAAEFDSPVVLKTYRPDEADFKKNYAYVYKNRGNKTGVKYLIHSKKITT